MVRAGSSGSRAVLAGVALVAVLSVLAALSACTTTGGSPASRNAPVVPVPAAQPAGGAYGRLMDADGNSVPGGSVTLTQPFDDNVVLFSVRLVSLGLFCLIPDAKLCPEAHGADVSDDGLWSVPADEIERGKALTVGGSRPGPGGAATGAQTSVSVPNGPAPRHVPDLVLWEPELTFGRAAGGTRVTWPALSGVPAGRDVRYALFLTTGDGAAQRPAAVATGLRRTSAVVPGWRTEDQPIQVTVVASTRRGRAVHGYTSPSAAAAGQAVPLSRGRSCLADQHGRLVRAPGTCPLTDGDLDSHEQVRLRGECDADDSACQPPDHHRLCVDLGTTKRLTRVVVRSPFGAVDRVVELSADGRAFRTVGRLADTGGEESGVFAVPVRPAASARFACVRSDDFGLSGAALSEISAW